MAKCKTSWFSPLISLSWSVKEMYLKGHQSDPTSSGFKTEKPMAWNCTTLLPTHFPYGPVNPMNLHAWTPHAKNILDHSDILESLKGFKIKRNQKRHPYLHLPQPLARPNATCGTAGHRAAGGSAGRPHGEASWGARNARAEHRAPRRWAPRRASLRVVGRV